MTMYVSTYVGAGTAEYKKKTILLKVGWLQALLKSYHFAYDRLSTGNWWAASRPESLHTSLDILLPIYITPLFAQLF